MFVATLVVTACAGLSPYQLSPSASPFGWVPLMPYYEQATVDAATDAIDTVLQVMPFGFVVGLLYPGKPRAMLAGAAGIALSSTGIELLQRYLPGRVPDITDVIMAVAGVGLGYIAASRGAAWYRALVGPSAAP
jgi:glycopeptide antibiotics resistance protein